VVDVRFRTVKTILLYRVILSEAAKKNPMQARGGTGRRKKTNTVG
jgi:hypothetical protein